MIPDGAEDFDSKFWDVIVRGTRYREDYEFTFAGETVDIQLKPLATPDYRRLMKRIRMDMSDEEAKTMMQDLQQADTNNMTQDEIAETMDARVAFGQVGALIEAAKLGIDPESVNLPDQDAVGAAVDNMIGDIAMDIGIEVMNVTDMLQNAEEFPGSRTGE